MSAERNVPKSAAVEIRNNRAVITVNGTAYLPYFYSLTHSYAGRLSWEAPKQAVMKKFADAGVRLYQVDVYFEDIWLKDRADLDLDFVTRQLGGVLSACPDAGIVLRIHVNAPFWWNEANLEECTQYADGPADWRRGIKEWSHEAGDNERCLRASLASIKWREEAGARLTELCTRLAATPEGNALIGFHVAGGIFGEWHYWGSVHHEPDTGPAMTAFFRRWLQKKYHDDETLRTAWNANGAALETATAPDAQERAQTGDGILIDPAGQQRLIDYCTCQMEAVADAIEFFCGIVKKTWPRPVITGIFYGYYHMMFNRHAIAGHGCIERILNSPVVDYLSAPQSYWGATRESGGSGNSRGVIESALMHGKLWLDEVDNGGYQKTPDDPLYLPVARRSAAVPLMRGQGFWYYDFGIGSGVPGWWGGAKQLEMVRAEKTVFDRLAATRRDSTADVLFVWDYESMYYVKNGYSAVSYAQTDEAIEEALRSGASIDEIYLFDLERADLERYRAIVFANTLKITARQRRFITERVAKNNRTLIWNYLPGITDGRSLDLDAVSAVAGMRLTRISISANPVVCIDKPQYRAGFKGEVDPVAAITDPEAQPLALLDGTTHVVMARKKLPDCTAIYASLPVRGAPVFRELFREAGCHIYCESDDPVWANSQVVLVHGKQSGTRKVTLRNGKRVTMEFAGADTAILDAATGQRVL